MFYNYFVQTKFVDGFIKQKKLNKIQKNCLLKGLTSTLHDRMASSWLYQIVFDLEALERLLWLLLKLRYFCLGWPVCGCRCVCFISRSFSLRSTLLDLQAHRSGFLRFGDSVFWWTRFRFVFSFFDGTNFIWTYKKIFNYWNLVFYL